MVFPVVMYGCSRWTIKKAEHQRIDAHTHTPNPNDRTDCRRGSEGPGLGSIEEENFIEPGNLMDWGEKVKSLMMK